MIFCSAPWVASRSWGQAGKVSNEKTASVKIAADTPLLKVIESGPTGTDPSSLDAQITRLQDALKHYGTSDPWACKAFYEMAYSQYLLGRFNDAVQNSDAALALPESHPGIHLVAEQIRFLSFQSLGRLKDAFNAAEAIRNIPSTSDDLSDKIKTMSYILEAQSALRLPNRQQGSLHAALCFSALVKDAAKHPKNTEWQKNIAYALRGAGADFSDAGHDQEFIQAYDEFLKRFPNNPDAAMVATMQMTVIRHGLVNLKPADMEAICAKYPTNTPAGQYALYELGESYIGADEYRLAVPVLAKVMNYQTSQTSDPDYHAEYKKQAGSQLVLSYTQLHENENAERVAMSLKEEYPTAQATADASRTLHDFRNLGNPLLIGGH